MAQSVSLNAAGSQPRSALADLVGRAADQPLVWAVALVALIAYVARAVAGAAWIGFSTEGMNNIGQILAPVVLMSLFIERATEVIISSWRDPAAQHLQHVVDAAEGDSQIFAQRNLDFYRLNTQRIAFALSFTLAVITALVGFRVVEPLLDAKVLEHMRELARSSATVRAQLLWLGRLDILLAGLLMAGGADGIHQIVTTFTSFLDSTRDRAAAPAGAAGSSGVQPQAPLASAGVHQNLGAQQQAAQNPAPSQPAAPPANPADAIDDGV
jgi:hypothetical protein